MVAAASRRVPWPWLAGLIPAVFLAGWMAKLAGEVRSGVHVRVPVVAYDPRDLVAGHYLQFQLDLRDAPDACRGSPSEDVCLCVGPTGGRETALIESVEACAPPPKCGAFLRGRCRYDRFVGGFERYYFDERHVARLRTMPPDSSVVLSVGPTGQARVERFLVGDETLEDYLAGLEAGDAPPAP
jgi:hypothetical protein